MSNHSNPSSVTIVFSDWSPSRSKPYVTTPKGYLASGTELTCITQLAGTALRCTLTSGLSSTVNLTLTNLYNPSSTKPYPMSIFVGGENISASLTVSQVQTNDLIPSGFNSSVGATSNTVIYFTPDYYFSTQTFL